jgi:hypothetical protein
MSKIGFPNLASINGPGGKKSFTGPIRTDGVGIDFICARPVKKRSSRTTPASIRNDIGNLSEAVVWGVDPGIREVFVASDGTANEKHRVRRTSTAEYYQLAGFKKICDNPFKVWCLASTGTDDHCEFAHTKNQLHH